MQICFIIENSLTMLQKSINSELSIFDQVKHSVESVVKNIFRNSHYSLSQQSKDTVHLFVTSSTEPVSSHADSNEMHVVHQLKNLECTIPTFPAQAIESALYHIGKYRCLNESETFLGYRQGTIFQPALIFYITDNSNPRQITKINQKFLQNKLQLRAEYKLFTIKYCSLSPNDISPNNFQKQRSFFETKKQTLMMEEIMRKVNGRLICVYSKEDIITAIQDAMAKHVPSLRMGLTHKEYNIYNKQIVKLQFPNPKAQQNYAQRLKKLKQSYKLTRISESSVDLLINAVPAQSRTKIPLPHELTPKHLNANRIIIDEFEQLKYYVDFTKEYVGTLSQPMKFLFNTYQFYELNLYLLVQDFIPSRRQRRQSNLYPPTEAKDFGPEKKFPLFYEKKKTQYLIGYLRMYFNLPQNPSFELNISFSNFTTLNAIIRSYQQRSPIPQQQYISSLPIFYHKFLKYYLPSLNINLSAQSNQLFQNIHTKPIGVTNMRVYEQRMTEKNKMVAQQKESLQKHKMKTSECCSVYSDKFQEWEQQRSRHYLQSRQENAEKDNLVTEFFKQKISKLIELQPNSLKFHYLTPQQIHSSSVKRQLQKYSNIRRNDQETDQLVGGLFGNPFKKINKKVKLDDEAESVWVEPQDVGTMKEFFNKEIQVFYQMHPDLTEEKKAQIDKVFKNLDSMYDKCAEVKGIIANVVENEQKHEKKEDISNQLEQQNSFLKKQSLLQNKIIPQPYISNQSLKESQQIGQKIVEQHLEKEEQTYELSEELQRELYNFQQEAKSTKVSDPRIIPQLQPHIQASNMEQMVEENLNAPKTPEIISEINSKFPTLKSALFEVPSHLIHNELYLKNKAIISEALLSYLGLSQK